jgi:glycosyltransferase involved in cell wall biosynthesis
MAATIWVDVEDLFDYARGSRRPSGIQRLAFEIFQVLQARFGESGIVRFVRHDPVRNSLVIVPWPAVAALFAGLTDEQAAPQSPAAAAVAWGAGEIRPHSAGRQLMRTTVHRLPAPLRARLVDALLAQEQAVRAWARLAAWLGRQVLQAPRRRPGGEGAMPQAGQGRPPGAFADLVASGDVFLVLGSPWSHPDYAGFVRLQRQRHGLRFALLVYDLIPLRRPEWCDRGLVRLFRAWFEGVLPMADQLFAISRATAADVEAYARENGIALPGAVVPVPIGTGFGEPAAAIRSDRLPAPGSYVLVVSTIEARKNHLLAFRVWRRLLEERPRETVPTLVFAGRVGWLVDDLMQQIANTDNLDGKLVLVLDPTDAELATLYRGCLFTLYPSFFEGWGLPVTESLAFGKPCVTSDRTSLPEAGGDLARRFDPDDLNDAYAVIADTIDDRAGLAAWEERVRREFVPVPWTATVEALLASLDLQPVVSGRPPGAATAPPRPAAPPVPAS